jgi:hypothetical protein
MMELVDGLVVEQAAEQHLFFVFQALVWSPLEAVVVVEVDPFLVVVPNVLEAVVVVLVDLLMQTLV